MNTLKQTLDNNGYTYSEADGKITVTRQGYVNLDSLKILPAGTSFSNQGDVNLRSLTTLPEGTSFDNGGYVNLPSLTTLPAGTSFSNQGDVNLRSLTTLPEGTSFRNQGYVNLDSLKILPAGTSFDNGGYVNLRSLTTLPAGTSFRNGGYVNLDSLKILPAGTSFSNQGDVYLGSLTTLPDGTSFRNGGYVDLESLTDDVQTYRGKKITLRSIDGYTMLIESEKTTKGITVCKARYFGGGQIKDLTKCYVAKVGDHWAHGKTVKEAIQDATDKATLNSDVAEVVAEIKRTGMVTIAQYRAITGACREGCRQFLTSIGKPDATKLPLIDVMQQVKGHYGFDRFQEVLNH